MDKISDLAYDPIEDTNEEERQEKMAEARKKLRGVLKQHSNIKKWIKKIKKETKNNENNITKDN